jgi:glycosyltransferase involved in cell wall biosynthesis
MEKQTPSWLFVLPWDIDYPGGVNQVVINLARAIPQRAALRPIVMVSDWECVWPRRSIQAGLPIIRLCLPPLSARGNLWRHSLNYLRRLQARWVLRRILHKERVAVINLHYPGEYLGLLLDVAGSRSVAVSVHGTDVTRIGGLDLEEQAHWREWARRASAWIAPSHALAERTSALLLESVSVVHNGLDAMAFLRQGQSQRPLARPYVLCIAKFEIKKGIDVLLRAYARWRQVSGDAPDLVLIGANGPMLSELRTSAEQLGVVKNSHFLVDLPHEQIAPWVQHAKCMALCSRQEPFGIVLLEAGAWRLPVVASRVDGIQEIIEDGRNGRLVDVDDVNAVACALQFMQAQPEQAAAWGEALYNDVLERFTWERAADRYLEIAGISRCECIGKKC